MKGILHAAVRVTLLILLFAAFVFAQELSQMKPTLTLREQVEQLNRAGVLQHYLSKSVTSEPLQPSYCNPCLFYAGDSDPNGPNPDGVWAQNNSFFGDYGVVYSPFIPTKIGKGKSWAVSGLFANMVYYPNPPSQPDDALWSIVSGVVDGAPPSSAITVCSGTDTAPTLTATGRVFFEFYFEYTTAVSVTGCTFKVSKKTGTLWETVTPEYAVFQLAFEMDAEDNGPSGTPPEAFGTPQPWDDSFFVGNAAGNYPNFTPTHGVVCGVGCDRFSAGVVGTMAK